MTVAPPRAPPHVLTPERRPTTGSRAAGEGEGDEATGADGADGGRDVDVVATGDVDTARVDVFGVPAGVDATEVTEELGRVVGRVAGRDGDRGGALAPGQVGHRVAKLMFGGGRRPPSCHTQPSIEPGAGLCEPAPSGE